MCGRFVNDFEVAELESRLEAISVPGIAERWRPRWNAAPTQSLPVLVQGDRVRQLQLQEWGWQRSFLKKRVINARGEEVRAKRMFRNALDRHRCLVPIRGFYEWRESDRQPCFFTRADGDLMAIGGFWEHVGPAAGDNAFLLLTVEANAVVSPTHHRQAWMVRRDLWQRWLDPQVPFSDLVEEVRTTPAEEMSARLVSKEVNRVKNDGPHLIWALGDEVAGGPLQRSLSFPAEPN